MTNTQIIEMVQVRWDGVLVFKYYNGSKGQSKKTLDKARAKAYSGKVTEAASKRMVHAIDMIIQLSRLQMKVRPNGKLAPFRLGFLTLTVAGSVKTPKAVHVHFKKFLDWLRYRNCLYIWKAEYQKRGQVHYHLIINQYIPWVDLRDGWNRIQKKAGYLNGYALKTGHFNPNSVDIRSVRSNKALSRYLRKYLVKPGGHTPKRPLAKWWGASRTLLDKKFTSEMWSGDWEAIKNSKEVYEDEEGRWKIAKGRLNDILSDYTRKQYLTWRKNRRSSKWKPASKKPKPVRIIGKRKGVSPQLRLDILKSEVSRM